VNENLVDDNGSMYITSYIYFSPHVVLCETRHKYTAFQKNSFDFLSQLWKMKTNFQNSFTNRFTRKHESTHYMDSPRIYFYF